MWVQKEVEFIAGHYKEGLFAAEPALYRIKGFKKRFLTVPKIAAISSFVIAIGAMAAILITKPYDHKETGTGIPAIEKVSPVSVSRVIDFDDVPLTAVVEQIRLIYNVDVTDMPQDADELYVTIHYEGTVSDLIETLNEILGTNMRIKE